MNEQEQQAPGRENGAPPNWEQQVISRIALEGLREQRRARRWSVFFRLCILAYLAFFFWLYLFTDRDGDPSGILPGKHTALIHLEGVIGSDQTLTSSEALIDSLQRAFENKQSVAVILHINSPGGSPVQAGEVHDTILELRKQHPEKAIYTVVSDICASGGYYIAAATDEIYANRASLVGSIGVVYSGFGFVESLEKLGIQRRLLTAGARKGILDPFSPLQESDVEHFQELLDDIHHQFIEVVRSGRGERLLGDEAELFSGLLWSGEQSLELGLVDGLGDLHFVAREVIGREDLVDYTRQRSVLESLLGTAGETFARGFLGFFSEAAEQGELR